MLRVLGLSNISRGPRRSPGVLIARCMMLVAMLSSCAAPNTYNDGKVLLAQGKTEEGMARFQEALKADPQDARYRQAYLEAREHVLTNTVEQADQRMAYGALDDARALYRHALSIEPSYERALDGVTAVEVRRRQLAWLDEADGFAARNQFDLARQRIARVLTEAPNDARALALQRSIDLKTGLGPPEARLAQIYRKPITIEFKDVALKQIFEVISHTSGLNFLFDKDVRTDQRASIFLKNSDIESTVNYVLLTNQLDQQVLDGNTVLIYPNTPAKQKDYQELDVRTFYLANAEAKTVANTLKTILKTRDIAIDEKLNMVVIRDTPEAIKMAEKLVTVEDVADPEVMLEVEVLEVSRTSTQDLGVQWPASVAIQPTSIAGGVSSVASGTGTSGNTGSSSGTGTSGSSSIISLHDLTSQTSRSLGVTFGSITANANLQDGDAKLLTNPRIRVRNHEKAKILIGERVPTITSTATSTGFLSESVNYLDVGLTLNVEPTIYLDDDVGIKIGLEVSSLMSQVTTQSGTTAYQIGTRTASTVLRLKNGETDVLAGLIDSQERTSGNKIPGLGDIPILGRLFGASTDDDQKTEIVLSITPHLIRNIQRPDAANAHFNSGTETSMRAAGRSGGEGGTAASPAASSSSSSSPSSASGSDSGKTASPSAANGSNGLGSSGSNGLSDNGLNQNGENTGAGTAPSSSSGDLGGGGTAPPGIAQLQLQSASQVAVGGTLTLNLQAQSTEPVTNLPVTLSFDTTKLEVTNIAEGPFMRASGATSFSNRLSTNGQLTLSDAVTSGNGATAEGIYATVTFKALAPTQSTSIQVLSATPTGLGGVPITLVPPTPFALQITSK
jgi:general secretion pathway protein D